MYSSNISSDRVMIENTSGQVMCGDFLGLSFELYPVVWWLNYNVDAFGPVHFDEWAQHWFVCNINDWCF